MLILVNVFKTELLAESGFSRINSNDSESERSHCPDYFSCRPAVKKKKEEKRSERYSRKNERNVSELCCDLSLTCLCELAGY